MYVLFTFFLFNFVIKCSSEINKEIPLPEIETDIFTKEESGDNIISDENYTIGDLYQNAVQSYLEEDWEACVQGFEEVRQRYRKYKEMVIYYRKKCRKETANMPPTFPENIDNMHFYEKKLKETLCLLLSTREYEKSHGKGSMIIFPREVENKLADYQDYEYIHICYFQTNRFQKAANAIFTFLAYHPGHKISVRNLQHYLTLSAVARENIVNLEIAPFVSVYREGTIAYENEEYRQAIINLENSLKMYLESEQECRLYCEGPFDQGWLPDFTMSLANHFTYCLQCKENCTISLSTVNGEYQDDLLASHYHYLQFAYYKVGNIQDACAAVESYLLFYPADEIMLNNKKYYAALPKVKEDYFSPRKEALKYIKRQVYERKLLQFISDEFRVLSKKGDKELDNVTVTEIYEKNFIAEWPNADVWKRSEQNNWLKGLWFWSIRNVTSTSIINEQMKNLQKKMSLNKVYSGSYIRIIASADDLGGKLRYAAEGFLNESECSLLIKVAKITAVEGDGYLENKSPHSKFEKFQGATIGRIALMVYFGLLPPELLELLLRASEAVKAHLEKSFNLKQSLYFTFTHLAYRSSLPGSPQNRQDLSHKIHADNCVIKNEKNCTREKPAYIWRDYSSILYLNSAFDGGEFIFSKDHLAEIVEGTVRPRCGRMVAFSADETNLHGVRAVTRGNRFAVALWFTYDKRYLEVERFLARAILKRVDFFGPVEKKPDFQMPLEHEQTLINIFKNDKILQSFMESW